MRASRSSACTGCSQKTEGFHLTSPDRAVRERTAEYLIALAEGLPRPRWRRDGVRLAATAFAASGRLTGQAFELAAETFRQAMPFVAAFGVTICMEPLTPAETDFITTVR